MSVFAGPKTHAANPPETWEVRKHGRMWGLFTKDGEHPLETLASKRAAETARTEGVIAALYARETRWYAGEEIPGWKSHAECLEENKRIAERWPDGPMAQRLRDEYGPDILTAAALGPASNNKENA